MNAWQNRIVSYSDDPIDELLANPANWRTHPKHQQDALRGVLSEVGIVQNIIVNDRTGHLVDGHLRVQLAYQDNQPTVPVTHVDLSEDEEREILATLDPIAALATTDAAKLDELLRDVQSGEAGVQAMLAELAEKNGVIPPTFDASQEWVGMPEFEHPDINSAFQVVVHFASAEDVDAFERLIGQTVPRKSKVASSIWYPEAEQLSNQGLGYMADEP